MERSKSPAFRENKPGVATTGGRPSSMYRDESRYHNSRGNGKFNRSSKSFERDQGTARQSRQPHTEGPLREVEPKPIPTRSDRSGTQANQDPVCWNCDKIGHLYRDCDLPKRLRCFYCKADGVPTTRCPCRQGNRLRARVEGGPTSPRRQNDTRPPTPGNNGSRS